MLLLGEPGDLLEVVAVSLRRILGQACLVGRVGVFRLLRSLGAEPLLVATLLLELAVFGASLLEHFQVLLQLSEHLVLA